MKLEADFRLRLGGFQLDIAFENCAEPLGILGPSGSGKSLTLKCLAGLMQPDSGRIVLNDRVLFDSEKRIKLRPQQREVAYLFQNYALFPHWDVRQNILCAARGSRREKEEQVKKLLQRFQLEALVDQRPHQLSGGQQQRVALARILASRPRLLLLDEPLSALDADLQQAMRDDLLSFLSAEAEERKMLTVVVSHNFEEVYQLSHQLLVLEAGQLLCKAATKEVFAQPRLPAVARLTGCRNVLRAEKLAERRLCLRDWNVELEADENLPDALTHIALRAAGPVPLASDDQRPNSFAVRELRRVEKAFCLELCCLPENADSMASPLWVEVGRTLLKPETCRALYIAPELILPLTQG